MSLFKAFQDFGKKTPQQVPTQVISNMQRRPDKAFFNKLADFESQISREPTLELINEVLAMYRQCVEYFDSQQEPIKYYFVDKIQNALAETRTFHVIRQQKKVEEKIPDDLPVRSKRPVSMVEAPTWLKEKEISNEPMPIILASDEMSTSQKFSSDEEDTRSTTNKTVQNSHEKVQPPITPKPSQPIVIDRKARARKLNLQVQIQEQTEEQTEKIDDFVHDLEDQQKEADRVVREDMEKQAQSVKNRLAKRNLFPRSGVRRNTQTQSQRNLEEADQVIVEEVEQVRRKSKIKTDDDMELRRSSHLIVQPVKVTFVEEVAMRQSKQL